MRNTADCSVYSKSEVGIHKQYKIIYRTPVLDEQLLRMALLFSIDRIHAVTTHCSSACEFQTQLSDAILAENNLSQQRQEDT